MKLGIRLAVPEDADKCALFHIRSWDYSYSTYVPKEEINRVKSKRNDLWKKLLDDNTDTQYVIVNYDKVAGIISIAPSRDKDLSSRAYELVSLYLEPDYIGEEIGSFAMEWILGEVKRSSFNTVSLWVHTNYSRAK